MAKKKESNTQIEQFEVVDQQLNKIESVFESHWKEIALGVLVAALLVVGVFVYQKSVRIPAQNDASEAIFKAQQLFARDSFQLALDGNGIDGTKGFLEIIDEYGSTPAGNLANAYVGLCYKGLGDYESAISYLNKFDGDDVMVSPAILGSIGDCYWDLGETGKAASYYQKAASGDNLALTPFYKKRLAILYLSINENKKAIDVLESIKKEYPQSSEIPEVERFLTIAKGE